jgi:riboflavin kinase
MRPDSPRPTIIGPDSGPEAPFPLRMKGKVVSGFGRGSKEVRVPWRRNPLPPSLRGIKANDKSTRS